MGESAEYQMELDAEARLEERMRHDGELNEPRRPLLCWIDGELDYIWDWEPGTRECGIFAGLHSANGIGRITFLSEEVPTESEVTAGIDHLVTASPDDALYEIIVISRDDVGKLRDVISTRQTSTNGLKDRVIADMFGSMADFIDKEPFRPVFVFARTL